MGTKALRREEGFALIITVLITAVLVAVIAEVVFSVHTHAGMIASYRDGQRAAMLSEGGVELASSVITELQKGNSYTYFNPADMKQVVPEGDGTLTISIEDEQGKFNPNTIVYTNGETNTDNYNAYVRLLKTLKVDDRLADTLADWVDVNDVPRPRGAESHDYYGRLANGYNAGNASIALLDEMLMIKDYTPENYRRLMPYMTVYTDGLININTASKEVIMSLSDNITSVMAQSVVDYRDKAPFKDVADIRKVAGFETVGFAIQGRITVKSNIFKVYARGAIGDGIRTVEAVVNTDTRKNLFWRER